VVQRSCHDVGGGFLQPARGPGVHRTVPTRLLALAVLCACTVYDPCDELRHRTFPDAASAIRAILAEAGGAKVYAIGEYHPSRRHTAVRTPLEHFSTEILDVLVPHASHLVVETWIDAGCSASSRTVEAQVRSTLGRPPGTTAELEALVLRSARNRLRTHGLAMTCIEHGALLDGRGRVDFVRLLVMVTEKLATTTRRLIETERAVIVYGGAVHNDLYPRWPLAELSYAYAISRELGGGVLEIDLVVPEIVAPLPLIRHEDWFPLLGRAAPDRVLVWRRGPASYVVILPSRDLEVRKIALPVRRP